MINIKRICEGVSYVGVNDRTTEKFEALWPLPNGVSYNSFIVHGTEKTALIDTVHTTDSEEFLENIRDVVGGVDYLVVNHMEPDHSGSIPEILAAFPGLKIIGNKQTVGMIGGYYGVVDPGRYVVVADGDTIDLGGKSLTFYLTPMVHWPETMMTYVKEDGVLFSGDAFGCFGALNGGVTDREMDTEMYISEMYRYYADIVGKYGMFVQKALSKLKGLELKHICSTHGPVWEERIAEVAGIYDRLSRQEPEDGVTIIYGSMYGHTAAMAEEIARQLSSRGVRRIRIHDASHSHLGDMISDAFRYKGLVVGSPTYSMHIFPPVEQLLVALETREIKNKVVATFGSHTWAPVAGKSIGAYFEKMKLGPVAHVEAKQKMDAATAEACGRLAENMVEKMK